MPRFVVARNSRPQFETELFEYDILTIGRSHNADLLLSDRSRTVSRLHAALVRLHQHPTPEQRTHDEAYFVRDLGSMTGTRVIRRGSRTAHTVNQCILDWGDTIEIGDFRILVTYVPQGDRKFEPLRIGPRSRSRNGRPDEDEFPTSLPGSMPQVATLTSKRADLLQEISILSERSDSLAETFGNVMPIVLSAVASSRGMYVEFVTGGNKRRLHGVTGIRPGTGRSIDIAPAHYDQICNGSRVSNRDYLLVPVREGGGSVAGFLCLVPPLGRPFSCSEETFTALVADTVAARSSDKNAPPLDGNVAQAWNHIPIIGSHQFLDPINEAIDILAREDADALVLGESGTGKELIARQIHNWSSRSNCHFEAVNCATIPEGLFESEVFGAKRGAFTHAVADRRGIIESAEGGTLFLDEIGDLPSPVQPKLLRFMEQREFRKLGGGPKQVSANIRILGATDRDLISAVKCGQFRPALYNRFSEALSIKLPPLRERTVEVPLLAHAFLDNYACEHKLPPLRLSRRAVRALMDSAWPGNIRQLKQVVESAVSKACADTMHRDYTVPGTTGADSAGRSHSTGGVIFTWHLGAGIDEDGKTPRPIPTLRQGERRQICEALEALYGNKTHASEALGITHQGLLNKMRELGIPLKYGVPGFVMTEEMLALRNAIRHALQECQGDRTKAAAMLAMDGEIFEQRCGELGVPGRYGTIETVLNEEEEREKGLIQDALEASQGDHDAACKALSINAKALRTKMRRYGIPAQYGVTGFVVTPDMQAEIRSIEAALTGAAGNHDRAAQALGVSVRDLESKMESLGLPWKFGVPAAGLSMDDDDDLDDE